MNTIKIGGRVRSKGALYIQVSGQYRKVHNGVVLAVFTDTSMGTQMVCRVATKYGDALVNPSQLEFI